MSAALSGRGIVITRPREQAHGLAEAVRAEGGYPLVFPTLEILEPGAPALLGDVIDRLESFDLAIFISPIAASRGIDAIEARREFPRALRVAAVGSGSARVLAARGLRDVIAPAAQSDSESLLALPELTDVAAKRIVIFRGEGGRETLADTLRQRGAEVEYAACYRRVRPTTDVKPLLDAWGRGAVDAVVATSAEGLTNLCEMLGLAGRAQLAATPLFVPHPRIGAAARSLGMAKVVETESGDAGIINGLTAYFA